MGRTRPIMERKSIRLGYAFFLPIVPALRAKLVSAFGEGHDCYVLWASQGNQALRRSGMARATFDISVLVKISTTDCYEEPLDPESEVQRLYYGCPSVGSYSVCIDDVCVSCNPVAIKFKRSSKTSDYGFREARVQQRLFMPYWGLGDGTSTDPGDFQLQYSGDDDNGSDMSLDLK